MIAVTLALSLFGSQMLTCAAVRKYVDKYGREGAEQMARNYGVTVTDAMRRRAEACLAPRKEKT